MVPAPLPTKEAARNHRVLLVASLLLLAGCAPPTFEGVHACLEQRLPGQVGFSEDYPGGHITLDAQEGYDRTSRIWVAASRSEAERIEMNRKGNRTMGVFGMFSSDRVERRGTVVVEFARTEVPKELRAAVRHCIRG
jgi:hypothetical protein